MAEVSAGYVRAGDPFGTAAGLVAEAVERIARENGRARLALSGGSAARVAPMAAKILAERKFGFERLALTWVDERCVTDSSLESNRAATEFTHDPQAEGRPIGAVLPLYMEGEAPAVAVERVRKELNRTFEDALDVVLLGMGGDGHVASLFPGRKPLPGLVAHVADSPKPPPDRITLTGAMLRTARHTFLVATGEEKRGALTRLLAGDPDLPATGLPALVVCTDLEIGGSA